ncbi:hypothetical protein NRB15_00415 [Pseudomonas alliivorans]|uniref:hypothetical protein n=1 Tax=Pseudomonas alliivorans TaxID=2810613 RepID=UPI00211C40A5|nr:hypothetical protein [Pseudomonas alliivorans]MCQ9468793.1 hypothetical protein [Pseudomonas alliivorans]
MSEASAKIYEQALFSVLVAAEEKGLNVGDLYDRACELTEMEDSKVRFVDHRDSGDVALVISLAIARVKGLAK